jgi:hypothetical protein
MLPLTPQLLVSTAIGLASWEQQRTIKEADDDRNLGDTALGEASLGFVQFVGFWSHFAADIGCSTWPLPPSAALADLASFAERRCALSPTPLAGDVYLLASVGADRHVIAGVVAVVQSMRRTMNGHPAFVCITIEGQLGVSRDTDTSPSVPSVRLVRRRLSPVFGDCFIRWSDLGAQATRALSSGLAPLDYEVPRDLVRADPARRRKAA